MDKLKRVINSEAQSLGVKTIVSEHKVMGGEQSQIITLEVTNGGATPCNLVLGTPLGIPNEFGLYPTLLAALGGLCNDAVFAGTTTDNQGLGATFINALNNRFVRNQVFIEAIEIVTADAAQRGNRLTIIDAPYNSATDTSLKANKFNPVDTQFTGNDVLGRRGVVLGDFVGLAYQLNVGILVQMNLKIGAVNSPSFVKCGC